MKSNRFIFTILRVMLLGLLISFALTVSGQGAKEVKAVALTVSNLDSALAFYTKVLPFNIVDSALISKKEGQVLSGAKADVRVYRLVLGDENIELWEFDTKKKGRSIPADSKSNDLWFQHIAIVVNDMEAAYERLRSFGVRHVSSMPQTLPDYLGPAAGIKAFYFRDPDGHNLELIYFPPGKGKDKWHH